MMVPFPFVIILMVQLSGKGKPMITYKIDQNILVSVDLIGVREFTELGVLTTKLLLTLSNVKIMAQPYDSAIVIILVLVASAGRLTEANSIEEGMKELDKLSRVLQEPILDDTKIREMVRVDKIPIDEALKDLLAVIKFMTVEHQLTLQSLRIVSVALEKLAKRMHFAAHPDGAHTSTKVEEEADTSVEHHELIRRAILRRIRRNAAIFEKSSQGIWSTKTRLSTSDSTERGAGADYESLEEYIQLRRCQEKQDVSFEVVEAKIVCDEKTKKFVMYTLAIKRPDSVGRGVETDAGEVERRYSDFLALQEALRREQPELIASIAFPRKALMGNFTSEVIEARCHGFEDFVTEIYLHKQLRLSPVFAEFLFSRDGRHGHQLMTQGAFREASPVLLNCHRVTEKLYGLKDPVAFIVLCLVVACLNACDDVAHALKYAELAVSAVSNHEHRSDIAIPLLILSLRLFSTAGRSRTPVEKALRRFEELGQPTVNLPTLLAVVLRIDISTVFPSPPNGGLNHTP
ncbi:sorting nexin-20-like isoform X1 [Varroa destructor]|uniref:PX domain-containing protein n=1 Tax=Varroa destructor TaxID=109461 RepID=A0A7M7J6D7_VARDE|nr:sorting nexin-20-like isoform X1 [Varroa destructor]